MSPSNHLERKEFSENIPSSLPLLEIRDLTIEAGGRFAAWPVVRNLSLSVGEGEIVGVVGESGCGKSLTALSIPGLLPAGTRRTGGQVLLWEGGTARDLAQLPERDLRLVRGAKISMIFQEPMTALNPMMPVGDQIAETLWSHQRVARREGFAAALEMMRQVGIPDPEQRMKNYPHQLSGGMRQRVLIAMALVCRPRLLVADEPTTALDVTIQAQILELLASLRERFGLALLLISHDLGVIAQVADRVAVMYAGRVVEHGAVRQVFANPAHPYTRGLLKAAPSLADNGAPARSSRLPAIAGQVPDPRDLPSGCSFEPRCDVRVSRCRENAPELVQVAEGHCARCLLLENN